MSPRMQETIAQLSFKETLKIGPVRRLWLAQLVSIFGDFLAVFAVFSIVTFDLHGTPFQVAMILVAYFTPIAVIGPVAGVYVDKWNVKWTMIASDSARAALVLILFFEHNLFAIYATLFLISCISSFFLPAQIVAIRCITPPNALVAANGLMSQAQQGAQIVAPAIMGLLTQFFGANVCFAIDCFGYLFSATMVSTLAIHRDPGENASDSTVLQSLKEGLRFIFTHRALSMVILSMTAGMFAIRCFGSLLSIYVRDVLHGGTTMFGVQNSLIGFGMIGGAQLVPKLMKKSTHEHLVAYGLGGMGVAVLLSAVWPRLWPATAAMLLVGFFAAFVMVCAQVLIQQETPHELLGRVSSTLWSLLSIAQVLALLGAGPVAGRFGVIDLYYFSAAALVITGAVGYWKLESHKPEQKQSA
jgi:MFS transporter, DHA3 family, macrolide efflux protein